MLSDTFDRLVRVEIALWDAVDGRLRAEHGQPAGRLQVLRVIARLGEGSTCRVQDVAAEVLVTVGGVSKLVDRLEAAGLCERRPNPDDRRSSLLQVTAAGRDLLAQVQVTLDDELGRRFAVLDDDAVAHLDAALTALDAR